MKSFARTFLVRSTVSLALLALAPAAALANPQEELDEKRAQLILEAFNSDPGELLEPLTRERIRIFSGQGRVDINTKAKYSYFIHTADAADPSSPILLLPLATSRFAPNYYQTDEWWDAHRGEIEEARRSGQRPPKQDMAEVKVWLERNKLSVNPPVLEIDPSTRQTKRTRLRDYVLRILRATYSRDGKVTLYRGAEKEGEAEMLERGEIPRGMRYWTPTADYAWRYARKNPKFLDELVSGRAPLLVFKASMEELEKLTDGRRPRIVPGFELTKNAHSRFEYDHVFQDHLYQMIFPGTGELGVEIELRGTRQGSREMVSKFQHPITIEELALDRIRVLTRARKRIRLQYPERANETELLVEKRIRRLIAEADILIALKNDLPREFVSGLLSELPYGTAEIGYVDSTDFTTFVRSKIDGLPSDGERAQELRKDHANRTGLFTLKDEEKI